jgi:hypothetical protein
VSHPIPLHPDADLAVVLDDLRQSVEAWGDEGMVMRVFRVSVCLLLLSILDTLIDLLADFRAGRLPPVLPAEDELPRRVGFQPTIATKWGPADEPPAPAARPARACRTDDPPAASADAPEQCATEYAASAPCRPGVRLSPPSLARLLPGSANREIAWSRSRVPRWPRSEFEGRSAAPTHAHFVATTKRISAIPRRALNPRLIRPEPHPRARPPAAEPDRRAVRAPARRARHHAVVLEGDRAHPATDMRHG